MASQLGLSSDQLKELKELFRCLDSNHSQTISLLEFRTTVRSLDKDVNDADIERTFKEMDKNGDGQIDENEFITKMAPIFKRSKRDEKLKLLRETFDTFDVDKNGSIDINEFTVAMKNLGMPHDAAHIKKLMNMADIDGDENINFAEFLIIAGV